MTWMRSDFLCACVSPRARGPVGSRSESFISQRKMFRKEIVFKKRGNFPFSP